MAQGSGRLKDEVAIVTGSTKNLGRGIAERFAREGAKVVVTGRTEALGKEVVHSIKGDGGEAFYFQCDLNFEDEVQALVQACIEQYDKLTIVINNAAPTELEAGPDAIDSTVAHLTTENFQKVFTPDYMGAFWTSKYVWPHMVAAGGGSIVNLASLAAVLGMRGMTSYSAAKSAMMGLTRSIAVEGAEANIRGNLILVGFFPRGGAEAELLLSRPEWAAQFARFQIAKTPDGNPRFGTAEDMADACLFLASQESSFINGVMLPVDGGAHCILHAPELGETGQDW